MTVPETSVPEESRDVPRAVGGGAATAPLLEGLDRLRDALLQRLEQIEALAAEQTARLQAGTPDRERALRERVTLLEASQARLQAEVKRREQEWQDLIQEMGSDRELLTAAWERLEREEIDAAARSATRPNATAPTAKGATTTPTGGDPRAAAPDRPASVAKLDPNDSVTRDILLQFQTLKNDVRRSAKGKNG
jgi:hypothetical protein